MRPRTQRTSRRGTPRTGRAGRVIVGVAVAVLILFSLASLASRLFGLDRPDTNYGGIVGHWLASGLVYAFGWTSFIIPILGAVAAVLSVLRRPPWRKFTGLGLLSLGLFVAASLLSYQTGSPAPTGNFGGWTGALLGRWLSSVFGFGAYALPSVVLLWGFGLWLRRPVGALVGNSTFLILLGLLLELFLGYFGPESYWEVLPGTAHRFPAAGGFGLATTGWLRGLIGAAGTIILLIAVVVVLLLVFVTVPLPSAEKSVSLLRRLLLALHPRPRPAVTPAPVRPPTVQARPEPSAQPAPSPVETESGAEAGPEPVVPEPAPREPGRPRPRRPLPAFDLNQFQTAFLDQLDRPDAEDQYYKDPREAETEAQRLLDKLMQFGIEGRVSGILSGPLITRFEFEPAPGIKINRIENLADDLSLALSAERIRILAPIPGKNAVGIEIPNKRRRTVHLRDILTSQCFGDEESPLGFALGSTITGEPYCADLRLMPHILIAGTTGSGKSVCINSIIASIIYRSSPQEVRFLTVDPKQLELPVYNSIPHLVGPTKTNPKDALQELTRITKIMDVRIGEFANIGVRDIASYNARARTEGLERKPYIVVVIDELADLMLRAANEIEEKITRLAQMSRAVGIHLILATQRPSVDVITGLIKANFPCRIAFQVASKTDSRTILDMNGAESLLGRGDMLFLPPGKGEPVRLHGSYISDAAARRIVNLWTTAYLAERLAGRVDRPEEKARELIEKDVIDVLYDPSRAGSRRKRELLCELLSEEVAEELAAGDYHEPLPEIRSGALEAHARRERRESRDIDEKFDEAARIVVRHKEASVSMLQRRLDIGWARAGRIIDQLEEAGIVGPYVGSKSRKVVVENEAQLQQLLDSLKRPGPAG